MSARNQHPGEGREPRGGSEHWRALAGDTRPAPLPNTTTGANWQSLAGPAAQPAPSTPPAASAWTYPYATAAAPSAPAPQAPAADVIVPVEHLDPVDEPVLYRAPVRRTMDPSQRALAAIITFACMIVAVWAMLGYMNRLTHTLNRVDRGNANVQQQLRQANVGLAALDTKTGHVPVMARTTKQLSAELASLDTDMKGMLTGVTGVDSSMKSVSSSLTALDSQLGAVNETNAAMGTKLGTINTAMQTQLTKVRAMHRDVTSTGAVLGTLQGRLNATNHRLSYLNGAINTMGCRGVTNNLNVRITFAGMTTGSANVYATVVPPGSWGHDARGGACG